MHVQALRLRHFRNIESLDLTPHPRFNIFWGQNGQGKTNLLEAIYLLSAVKSFRPQTNAALIQHGHAEAELEALVERGGSERLVKLQVHQRGKKVLLNNNPVRNLSDFFGTVNVVMFGPEDIQILKGGPSERRRFMDRAIFNAHPAFALETQHYEEVLKQRNALLKTPRPDAALLSIYDEQLIQYGTDIIMRRLDFIENFRPVMVATFRQIFDPEFEADIHYSTPWHNGDLNNEDDESVSDLPMERVEIEKCLEAAIASFKGVERERGYTMVGPHRDDLLSFLNGHSVRTFASQGQHRAFVLAMKIAEIRYLEERYRFAPILLLDDVSSELDRERNRYLFDFLRGRPDGQVFITTTHRDYILLDDDVQAFNVKAGSIAV